MTSPVRQGTLTGALPRLCVHPAHTTLEAVVAHIVNTLQPHFTGHVGPVRFVNGHAETADPELVEYFRALPDNYDVTDADEYPHQLPASAEQALQALREKLTADTALVGINGHPPNCDCHDGLRHTADPDPED